MSDSDEAWDMRRTHRSAEIVREIVTRNPEKWRLVDLETGLAYEMHSGPGWHPSFDLVFYRKRGAVAQRERARLGSEKPEVRSLPAPPNTEAKP